ncbi:MAG: hypothetical protein GY750_10515 [Lentisphaerae bacterium]|nr:hypothetical protein [Lentisphaerota bacterium]MCP4101844.1 hypothetical protein [Lentisphaerota bacterium]
MSGKKSFILLLITVLLVGISVVTTAADFWFVQITDAHIGVSSNDNGKSGPNGIQNAETLKLAIDKINNLKQNIKFVAMTGDLFNHGADNLPDVKLAKSIFEKLKFPLYIVPGNHDIESPNNPDTVSDREAECAKAFEENFNPIFFKINQDGVGLYFVTTGWYHLVPNIPGYDPYERLKEEFAMVPCEPKIVFQHHPPLSNSPFDSKWGQDDLLKYQRLISTNNVKAVIGGHLHRFVADWVGRVPVYVCAPTGSYVGDARQSNILLYHYTNGKLRCYDYQVKQNDN